MFVIAVSVGVFGSNSYEEMYDGDSRATSLSTKQGHATTQGRVVYGRGDSNVSARSSTPLSNISNTLQSSGENWGSGKEKARVLYHKLKDDVFKEALGARVDTSAARNDPDCGKLILKHIC